jgi:hypothetical protein
MIEFCGGIDVGGTKIASALGEDAGLYGCGKLAFEKAAEQRK